MSRTEIGWCHWPGTIPETLNPTTGCNKVSPGCKFCYAEKMHRRLRGMGSPKYQRPFLDGAFPHEDALLIPLKWNKPRTVFVDSMSDLFHENISFSFIAKFFAMACSSPQHTFIVLTKRADRMVEFCKRVMPWDGFWTLDGDQSLDEGSYVAGENWPPRNIIFGVSTEDQQRFNERVSKLMELPKEFKTCISAEPLLSSIDFVLRYPIGPSGQWIEHYNVLTGAQYSYDLQSTGFARKLDWVIAGGESGNRKSRPVHPDWIRDIQRACGSYSVPFFFKQWGDWYPVEEGIMEWNEGDGYSIPGYFVHADKPKVLMQRLGKKASGNSLDGITYQQFPVL